MFLNLVSRRLLAAFLAMNPSTADPTDAVESGDYCCLDPRSSEVSDAVLTVLYCSVYVIGETD
jgi:hypothetical protein